MQKVGSSVSHFVILHVTIPAANLSLFCFRQIMSTVLILGSSFVKRLERDLPKSGQNLGLDPFRFNVKCLGLSGATVKSITAKNVSRQISAFGPVYVMLQIGANDLDTQFGANTKVAEHLFSVAEWLVASLGVQSVAIMQLLRRTRTRHVDVEQFNASVDLANEQLRQLCKASDTCFFWRHKGMKDGINTGLCRDGVHLNALGMRKFILSIRGAILVAAKLRLQRSQSQRQCRT